ncbi:hypothetical protein DFJ74DRAFT_744835, partial [Hyaloraphidium curvatum]
SPLPGVPPANQRHLFLKRGPLQLLLPPEPSSPLLLDPFLQLLLARVPHLGAPIRQPRLPPPLDPHRPPPPFRPRGAGIRHVVGGPVVPPQPPLCVAQARGVLAVAVEVHEGGDGAGAAVAPEGARGGGGGRQAGDAGEVHLVVEHGVRGMGEAAGAVQAQAEVVRGRVEGEPAGERLVVHVIAGPAAHEPAVGNEMEEQRGEAEEGRGGAEEGAGVEVPRREVERPLHGRQLRRQGGVRRPGAVPRVRGLERRVLGPPRRLEQAAQLLGALPPREPRGTPCFGAHHQHVVPPGLAGGDRVPPGDLVGAELEEGVEGVGKEEQVVRRLPCHPGKGVQPLSHRRVEVGRVLWLRVRGRAGRRAGHVRAGAEQQRAVQVVCHPALEHVAHGGLGEVGVGGAVDVREDAQAAGGTDDLGSRAGGAPQLLHAGRSRPLRVHLGAQGEHARDGGGGGAQRVAGEPAEGAEARGSPAAVGAAQCHGARRRAAEHVRCRDAGSDRTADRVRGRDLGGSR